MGEDEDWMDAVESYPGPPLEAHLHGECSESGDTIRPGQTIRQTGDREWAHATCIHLASLPVVWE